MFKCVQKYFVIAVTLTGLVGSVAAQAATHHTRLSNSSNTSSASSDPNLGMASDDLIGFQFGPGVASANNSVAAGQVPSTDTRTRLNFGGFYEHRFLPYLAIRPEFSYIQRGASVSNGQAAQGAQGSTDVAANYFEIPVNVKGMYPIGRFTPYVLTGPYMGILVGSGATTSVPGQNDINNAIANTNTWEFGWNFGFGSSFAITRQFSAELAFRYSMGMTNFFSDSAPGNSTKLNDMMFLGGVAFAI